MKLTTQAVLTTPWLSWVFFAALVVLLSVSVRAQEVQPRKPSVGIEARPQLEVAVQPRATGVPITTDTNTSYTLLVNDLIRFEVYKEADLQGERRVDQDGTVSLPLIQTVRIGGKTIAEARALISALYEKDYLVSADVNITVLIRAQTNKVAEVKPKLFKFTVSGQVKKPGIVEIQEGEKVTLVDAILLAGDFTNVANKKSVTIIRMEKGVQSKYTENVQSMLSDPKSKRFEILPGDVISVKDTIF